MPEREFRVFVHEEEGTYWAEIEGLPGCFASGAGLDELREAVVEAITLYLGGTETEAPARASRARGRIDEMRVLVSA